MTNFNSLTKLKKNVKMIRILKSKIQKTLSPYTEKMGGKIPLKSGRINSCCLNFDEVGEFSPLELIKLYELYKIRKYNFIGGMKMRVQVILECTETKLRHYTTTKNKKTHPERLEMMKYNPVLKKHTLYKETKK